MKPYDPVKRREEYLKNYDKYKEQRKTYAENNKWWNYNICFA